MSLRNLFRHLLPYGIVLLLFAGGEVALRGFVPTLRSPLETEVQHDGYEWYELNRSYLQKYFPPSTPLIPEFKTALFKKHKAPNALRVFCLGGSSMFGTPYQMTCNISGMVRKQLRHLFPDHEVEVVNLGASAINTNVIRDLSRMLVDYQPDVVLIYAGHNEFYGPDGVGAGYFEHHFPSIIPLKYRVNDLALAAPVRSALRPSEEQRPGKGLNLMEQVSQGMNVHLQSSEAARIMNLYENNLSVIVETFRSHGSRVIVSDVASNLLFRPFVSDTVPTPVREEMARIEKGDEPSAGLLERFVADTTVAALQYCRGQWELRRGQIASARHALTLAKDNDLLKFRAPERINEITRRVCETQGVSFVSADSILALRSATGVGGDEMFWEHLHPTAKGYYEIASLFVREIVRLEGRGGQPGANLLPFDRDSLGICWLDEAYGDLSIQHLTGRWPFTAYRRAPAVLDASDTALVAIARQAYARTIVWDAACYRTAAELWRRGDLRGAMTTYEAMLDEYPHNYYTHYLLGSLLNHVGRPDDALSHYRRSIALNGSFPNSRCDVGLMLINKGDFDGALNELQRSLTLLTSQSPLSLQSSIHYGIGAAYANKGDLRLALQHVDEALKVQPQSREAHALRAALLAAQGKEGRYRR